jgi:hypothetical protein
MRDGSVGTVSSSEVKLCGWAITGCNANKRRPAGKTINDIQFLMKHIEGKVKAAGAWTGKHTLENVDAMYQVVACDFGAMGTSQNARATQAQWNKFLNQIRKKLQREREAWTVGEA